MPMFRLCLGLAVLASTVESFSSPRHSKRGPSEFDDFRRRHGREYTQGSDEYKQRKRYFDISLRQVAAQNADVARTWDAGITSLADRSSEELAALRGWRPLQRPSAPAHGRPLPTELMATTGAPVELPKAMNWTQLKTVQHVRDQGMCGSCWAFAAVTALRAHAEIHNGKSIDLSVQQLVACTPNPDVCGGAGGCEGATAELAFDYALHSKLTTVGELPYDTEEMKCPDWAAATKYAANPKTATPSSWAHGIGFSGWERLPENSLGAVQKALVHQGPVAVSVAAASSWNSYWAGIHSQCEKDAVIDHAVLLVGYGHDVIHGAKMGYWLIQNSWGDLWGEDGFIRLRRREGEEEEKFCGWDDDPLAGSGCEKGPQAVKKGDRVRVCGTCGILYDVSLPHFLAKGEDEAEEVVLLSTSSERRVRAHQSP